LHRINAARTPVRFGVGGGLVRSKQYRSSKLLPPAPPPLCADAIASMASHDSCFLIGLRVRDVSFYALILILFHILKMLAQLVKTPAFTVKRHLFGCRCLTPGNTYKHCWE